jgi:hypothetical protein
MKKQDLYKRGRSCPEVTCLTFGKDRKKEFPQHFFCHGCDLLEDAVLCNMKNPKLRSMKKYMCTAGHTDLCHPTTFKKQYRANQVPKDAPATTAVAKDDDTDQNRSSPTKSPWKKKRRQMSQRRHVQEECEGSSSIASAERSNNDDDSSANSKSPIVDGGAPKPRKLFEASSRSCVTPSNSVIRDNFLEEEENDEDTFNPNFSRDGATRRKRVEMENAELSRQFSKVLSEFLNRPIISSRRKFPLRRCAKIIVQSILSFEWIHSEVTAAGSYLLLSSGSSGHIPVQSTVYKMFDDVGSRHSDQGKAQILVDSLWDETFLDGAVQSCMITKVREYLRTYVFTPWKILRAMDLTGFNLNLSGLEVLRRVDVAGKYMRGIIPSKSTILRSARKVEAAALEFCPFKMIGKTFREDGESPEANNSSNNSDSEDSDIGEGFEFDEKALTKTLFDAYGLLKVAKSRPVDLGLASDGAKLTNSISHVTAGLKFNDMALHDPITKEPLLLHNPDSLVQSRNLCFPIRMVIALDNKKTLDGFRPLYNTFRTGEVAKALDCHDFKMSFPGDMKLQWGALDSGGAAKVKEEFCYICPCRSQTLHMPQDKSRCGICRDKPLNELEECYHYPFMADPEVRQDMAEEIELLDSLLVEDAINANDEKQDPRGRQRMYVRRFGEMAVENDCLDIDF